MMMHLKSQRCGYSSATTMRNSWLSHICTDFKVKYQSTHVNDIQLPKGIMNQSIRSTHLIHDLIPQLHDFPLLRGDRVRVVELECGVERHLKDLTQVLVSSQDGAGDETGKHHANDAHVDDQEAFVLLERKVSS